MDTDTDTDTDIRGIAWAVAEKQTKCAFMQQAPAGTKDEGADGAAATVGNWASPSIKWKQYPLGHKLQNLLFMRVDVSNKAHTGCD